MKNPQNNFAFIDSQNLNLGIRASGWNLDFGRFRRYLHDKYSVQRAYLFIGYLPNNHNLYKNLESQGFSVVFKSVANSNSKIKGNTDAEMILHSIIKFPIYDKAVVVTGDGDFACLVEYLVANSKFEKILIPNQQRYSYLFNKIGPSIYEIGEFLGHQKSKLEYKTKSPVPGQNPDGAFSTGSI